MGMIGRHVIGKKIKGPWRGPSVALLQRVLAILRVLLIVALIMGILAATNISDHASPSTISNIKTYRTTNAALILAAIVGSAILAVMPTRLAFYPCRR